MPLAGWTSRACAKHQTLHDTVFIPRLVARNGDPLDSRSCPLIYYYEQLLADMRHIVTHLFEVIPRTILNPIPKAHSSPPPRNIKSPPCNSSSSAAPDHYAWRQPKSSKGKKKIPSADEHFQELARDIHQSNKKAHSSPPPRNIKSTPSNSSSSAAPDHYAWRQPKSSKGKKSIPSADEHFQELARDIHESNKEIN